MKPLLPAEILAVGMTTPVGMTAPSSTAALRAGIARMRESLVRGKRFQRQVMGLIGEEYLPPLEKSLKAVSTQLTGRYVRMLRLATFALQEVLAECKSAPPPLLLALPEASSPGDRQWD